MRIFGRRITPQELALELLKGLESGDISQPYPQTKPNNSAGGGDLVGAATGDNARVLAEQIINTVHQQLPKTASEAEELAAVLNAALEQLRKEQLDSESRAEAEGTVTKIKKEMAKPTPNGKLVKGWLGTIDAVSETVGKVIRGAKSIASMFVRRDRVARRPGRCSVRWRPGGSTSG